MNRIPARFASTFIRRGSDYINTRHITRVVVKETRVYVHMTERDPVGGWWLFFTGGNSKSIYWPFESNTKAHEWAKEFVDEIHKLN